MGIRYMGALGTAAGTPIQGISFAGYPSASVQQIMAILSAAAANTSVATGYTAAGASYSYVNPAGVRLAVPDDGSIVLYSDPTYGLVALTAAQYASLQAAFAAGANAPVSDPIVSAWAYAPQAAALAGAGGWLLVVVTAPPAFTLSWGASGAATDQIVIQSGDSPAQEFASGTSGGTGTANWLASSVLFMLIPVDAKGLQYPPVDAVTVNPAPGIYAGANVSAAQIATAQAANPGLTVYQATESAGTIDPSVYVSASTAAAAAAAATTVATPSQLSAMWTSLTTWASLNPTLAVVAGAGVALVAYKTLGKK